jgi:hypothetical protein
MQMLQTKPFMRMVKLTIERDTSERSNKEVLDNEIAIPYPTYFHPSSDAEIQSLVQWASESSQRVVLVSMAVGKRRSPNSPRQRLMNQCANDPRCALLLCEGHEASPGLAEEVNCKIILPNPSFSMICTFDVVLLDHSPSIFDLIFLFTEGSEDSSYPSTQWDFSSGVGPP